MERFPVQSQNQIYASVKQGDQPKRTQKRDILPESTGSSTKYILAYIYENKPCSNKIAKQPPIFIVISCRVEM